MSYGTLPCILPKLIRISFLGTRPAMPLCSICNSHSQAASSCNVSSNSDGAKQNVIVTEPEFREISLVVQKYPMDCDSVTAICDIKLPKKEIHSFGVQKRVIVISRKGL